MRQRIAPIQFVDGTDAMGSQQTGNAGGNDELGLPPIRQPAQGGEIQMIVVIVAEEHEYRCGEDRPTARPAAGGGADRSR